MTNHLKEILLHLSKRNVRFIVCGGVALEVQGVKRMTMDLDLSLDMDADNLTRFLDALRELKLTPRAPVPAAAIMDKRMREFIVQEKHAAVFAFIDSDNPYRQVDVMLTEEGDYDNLVNQSDRIDVDGFPISVVSREGLIRMKESLDTPREKDLADIRELRKLSSERRNRKPKKGE